MDHWILKGHTPIQVPLQEWGSWFEIANRHVAKTEYNKEIKISTVFLGIDHSFGGLIPILFETMVFGGSLDQEQERYSTWEDAEEGHKRMIERVKQAEDNAS